MTITLRPRYAVKPGNTAEDWNHSQQGKGHLSWALMGNKDWPEGAIYQQGR